MQIQWHYIEVCLAVLVFFVLFYVIVRYNRSMNMGNEIIPEVAEVDALMRNAPNTETTTPTNSDDIIGEVRILSPQEAKQRMEAMEKKLKTAPKSTLLTLKQASQTKTKKWDKPDADADTFIVFYVMAKPNHCFSGYDLYQALTSAGLTYGEMQIFHRYAEKSERTQHILFSVASAVKPGFITLDDIGAFSTIGLNLFMDFSKQKTASATFQLMLNAAKQLAEDLNGILMDSQRQPWSLMAENLCRRRIQQYNIQLKQ